MRRAGAFLTRTALPNAGGFGIGVGSIKRAGLGNGLNAPRCALSARVTSEGGDGRGVGGGGSDWNAEKFGYRVESERVLWKRYKTVVERNVRYPNGKLVSFDIAACRNPITSAGGLCASVFVFPFCTRTRTTTMLREYAPGGHRFHTGFVAGFYEPQKHGTVEAAARAEMSEEVHLKNGELVMLGNPIPADKYSDNRFYYFLALDPEKDSTPAKRDDNEVIETIPNVPLDQIRSIIAKGAFNAPNALLGLLALDELRNRGYHH